MTPPLFRPRPAKHPARSPSIRPKPVTRGQAHQFAEDAGLSVRKGISKGLDLLVIADPDSQSGKARKAREYGTRVIAEQVFWSTIGVRTD